MTLWVATQSKSPPPQMTATALALYDLTTRYNELSYLCKKYAREP